MGCLCCRPTSLDTDNSNAISFSHCDRRALLKKTFAGASALVATAASACRPSPMRGHSVCEVLSTMSPEQRRNEAFTIRLKTAIVQKNPPLPSHPTNGDDNLNPNFIGSFTKALGQNSLREVIPAS